MLVWLYDMIRDAILTCGRKPTRVSLSTAHLSGLRCRLFAYTYRFINHAGHAMRPVLPVIRSHWACIFLSHMWWLFVNSIWCCLCVNVNAAKCHSTSIIWTTVFVLCVNSLFIYCNQPMPTIECVLFLLLYTGTGWSDVTKSVVKIRWTFFGL